MKAGILAALLASSCLAFAQQAVEIANEPHYRLLLENDQYVFPDSHCPPMNLLTFISSTVS
jgi:hypothetical protein